MKLIMAYYIITSLIVFPANERRDEIMINKVHSLEINKSWKALTDTATVVLPRNTVEFQKGILNDLIKRGDKIEIHVGYDSPVKEFEGYVTSVGTDIPLELKCEDEMWKLKQKAFRYSRSNITLKELLEEISGIPVDCVDVTFPKILVKKKQTVAQFLQHLKDKYSLYSYIKDGTLVCGKIYSDDVSVAPVVFDLQRNVASNDLKYRDPGTLSVMVRVESLQKNGTKLTVEVGDPEGDVYEDTIPYLTIEAATEYAERRLELIQRGGFDGSYKAFGLPRVNHGERVDLRWYERDIFGIYFVDSLDINMDDTPELRQKITVGRAASI